MSTDFVSDILNLGAEQATQPKPEKGFSRSGYFDWEDTKHVSSKNVAVGVIFPPYAAWMDERVTAAKTGQPFNMPFMVAHGLHAVGIGKTKTYAECRRTLIRDNKVGAEYPMLPKDILAAGDDCPLCNVCWDQIWPKVQEFENDKTSPAYKAWKVAHKSAAPQLKYLMNFLPMGGNKVLVMDIPKTVAELLTAIHYDKMQPDLLWPISKPGAWMSTWIKIERLPQPDNTPMKYAVATCFQGMPLVINADKTFNAPAYAEFLKTVTDLRQETYKCLPKDATSTNKALNALALIAPQKIMIQQGVIDRVNEATAGHQPTNLGQAVPSSTPMPTSAPVPAAPPVQPVPPAMGMPPAVGAQAAVLTPTPTPTPAPTPVASTPVAGPSTQAVVKGSQDAIDLLASLLGQPK